MVLATSTVGGIFLLVAVLGALAIVTSIFDNEPGCFPIGLAMIVIGALGAYLLK
jgi:hypothetical protein